MYKATTTITLRTNFAELALCLLYRVITILMPDLYNNSYGVHFIQHFTRKGAVLINCCNVLFFWQMKKKDLEDMESLFLAKKEKVSILESDLRSKEIEISRLSSMVRILLSIFSS